MNWLAQNGAQIGFYGYVLTGFAFLALCAYVRTPNMSWHAPEARVRIACLVTALWAGLSAVHARYDLFTLTARLFLDAVQIAAWLNVLAILVSLRSHSSWLHRALALLPWGVIAVSGLAALLSMQPDSDPVIAAWVALLGLSQPLVGIFALEQVFRNATSVSQNALRWLFFGIGMMLAANFFLLAQAIAIQGFDVSVWHGRALVFALAALFVFKGLRAVGPNWTIGLFVSRQVVFYSTSFLLIGLYLVLMSVGASYLRSVAGTWGVAVQSMFVAALGAILLVLIFSGAIRRRLMAFVATHFYRNRYDYRLEWPRFVQTLSSRPAQVNLQQSAIRAVCQIVESGCGRLWLIDEQQRRYLQAADWQADVAPSLGIAADNSLSEFMRRSGWVVDLAEMATNPELYDNTEPPADLLVLGPDGIVVPLLHVDSMYGLLLLKRPPDMGKLHFEDRDLLKMVGRHLAAHLWQADIDRRLANSKQFEAYNRMTAFVMHDLKNLTAQLQLVVSNAAKHKRNPEFVDDAIATISNSVDRMGKLLTQLSQDMRGGANRNVSLADIARRVALRAGTRQPVPRVTISEEVIVNADPEQLSMVLDHVVRNAQDATTSSGNVDVDVGREAGSPQVRVTDDGHGMDDAFVRERLFKPFDTTKGARGMGIGAYQTREYLRSLGGDVLVETALGKGTTFKLVFPHG